MLRRNCLARMPLRSDGWFIDAEIVIWGHRLKLRILEIDVSELPRAGGRSKVRSGDVIHVLKEALEFRHRALSSP